MRFLLWLALGLGLAAVACGPAITAFGNFPGESCTDRASVRMIEVNWRSRQSYEAQYGSGEILPDLEAVEGIESLGVTGGRTHCKGTAVFADGTRSTVWTGWSASWEPNLVSGPGFSMCLSEVPAGCGRAAPGGG